LFSLAQAAKIIKGSKPKRRCSGRLLEKGQKEVITVCSDSNLASGSGTFHLAF